MSNLRDKDQDDSKVSQTGPTQSKRKSITDDSIKQFPKAGISGKASELSTANQNISKSEATEKVSKMSANIASQQQVKNDTMSKGEVTEKVSKMSANVVNQKVSKSDVKDKVSKASTSDTASDVSKSRVTKILSKMSAYIANPKVSKNEVTEKISKTSANSTKQKASKTKIRGNVSEASTSDTISQISKSRVIEKLSKTSSNIANPKASKNDITEKVSKTSANLTNQKVSKSDVRAKVSNINANDVISKSSKIDVTEPVPKKPVSDSILKSTKFEAEEEVSKKTAGESILKPSKTKVAESESKEKPSKKITSSSIRRATRNGSKIGESESYRDLAGIHQIMKRMSQISGTNKQSFAKASRQSIVSKGVQIIPTSRDRETSKADVQNIVKSIEFEVTRMSESDNKRRKSPSIMNIGNQSVTSIKYHTVRIVSETETDSDKQFSDSEFSTAGIYDGQRSTENAVIDRQISHLNFRISDTDLSELMTKSAAKKFTMISRNSRADYMALSEFEKVVRKLYKCCLKSVTDLHELHLRRLLALPIIDDIIARADPEYIIPAHIVHMVWSIMSCLHHFQLRLKSGSSKYVLHTRQRMVDKCMKYYLRLIAMFKPKMHRIILSALITFYKDGNLWDIEFACTDMIVALLELYPDVEDGLNDLLNSAVYSANINTIEAQKLMQVISEVLRMVQWRMVTRKFIDRIIVMLYNSISPSSEVEYMYEPMKMGIDLCIRHMIQNMCNIDVMTMLKRIVKKMVDEHEDQEAMLYFGNLACLAAAKYSMKSFYNITPDFLYNISFLAHRDTPGVSLIAMRIWLKLIDRNDNSSKVDAPRIFFQECDYSIVMRKYSARDKLFFKAYRNYFYELIIDCFKECTSREEMNSTFEMCALLLLEIPCGYTAATFTSVAMSIQEYAFNLDAEDLVMSHYLHATALSLLSLICYIHKADVFYKYVTNIIDRRAEWAPHLCPPLKPKYEYALHHILWNKPDLFFEDWETRYGLWKCFRITKAKKKKRQS